jgi:hypothetical protein
VENSSAQDSQKWYMNLEMYNRILNIADSRARFNFLKELCSKMDHPE